MIGVLLLSLGLAAVLGFAAHRASICTVRAVAEILSTGSAYCLASFGKSVFWVLAIIVPLIWLNPSLATSMNGFALSASSLIGGFVFGAGAALNGGCAFSTLARLAEGHLRMLVTLGGFALGVLISVEALSSVPLSRPVLSAPLIGSLAPHAGAVVFLLWGWALWELRRLWLTRPSKLPFRELVFVRQYRLSTAAALMGLANGLLYLFHGAWTYTGALRQGVEGLVTATQAPAPIRLSLFAAVFLGMLLSTWQRGSFCLRWRPRMGWSVNVLAGVLMGTGAVLIPGGNDALILYGIPSFSSHALPAYLAMLGGIATAILIMQRLTGIQMRIDCQSDMCVTEANRSHQS